MRVLFFTLLLAPAVANIALVDNIDELRNKTREELFDLFKQGTLDKGKQLGTKNLKTGKKLTPF